VKQEIIKLCKSRSNNPLKLPEGTVSCSSKQRERLIRFELTSDRWWVRRSTHRTQCLVWPTVLSSVSNGVHVCQSYIDVLIRLSVISQCIPYYSGPVFLV